MLQFKHKKNEKNVQIVQREVRMKKLLYRPKDAWVGDLIPYYENGTFYGYYLHDPRIRDKEYAEETTWHVIDNYGKLYAGKQQMSPIKTDLPDDVEYSDLYLKIQEDMQSTGENFLKPWDTYLDSNTNTVMQDNLLLLASGDLSVDDFCKLVDDSIAEYTK